MRLDNPLEKKKRQKWWLPLFGLGLAISLAVLALVLAPILRDVWANTVPSLRGANAVLVHASEGLWWGAVDLGFALVLWLLMFGLSVTLVLLVIGLDPAEKQAKHEMREAARLKRAERKYRRQR